MVTTRPAQIHMHVKLLHNCEYNSVTNVCVNFYRIYIVSYRYIVTFVIFPQCICYKMYKKNECCSYVKLEIEKKTLKCHNFCSNIAINLKCKILGKQCFNT